MHLPVLISSRREEKRNAYVHEEEKKRFWHRECNGEFLFYVKNIFTSLTRGKEYDMHKGITYI